MTNTPVRPFDPNAGWPDFVYRKLADHLIALITAGRIEPGEDIGGEVDLARRYQVSVATARRALQDLTARGVLQRGRVVADADMLAARWEPGDLRLWPTDAWTQLLRRDGTVTITDPRGNVVARTEPRDGESVRDVVARLGARPIRPASLDPAHYGEQGYHTPVQPRWEPVIIAGIGVAVNPITHAVSVIIHDRAMDLATETARDFADAINECADLADDMRAHADHYDDTDEETP